jgi:hypothetical protein
MLRILIERGINCYAIYRIKGLRPLDPKGLRPLNPKGLRPLNPLQSSQPVCTFSEAVTLRGTVQYTSLTTC